MKYRVDAIPANSGDSGERKKTCLKELKELVISLNKVIADAQGSEYEIGEIEDQFFSDCQAKLDELGRRCNELANKSLSRTSSIASDADPTNRSDKSDSSTRGRRSP